MYQVALGKISDLQQQPLSPGLRQLAPTGPRRAAWLAGRVLLSRMLFPLPLPEIIYSDNGKPAFHASVPLWFNLSHSGNNIALIVSDEGEVGCDIEIIRPRENWPRLADAVFSAGERQLIAAEPEPLQLAAFWRIWTCKEAILKQSGGHVWQMAQIDSTALAHSFVSQTFIAGSLSLALCTPTPYLLNINDISGQRSLWDLVELR
ncbi:4'-phosphopantetheinyl transferase AcpT [Pantoea sp. FN0302]|uniref:4'-phosphopantetheinyl transferase AcpT n=1 Tax=Pantoea sp. FN0302 TaxID=3418558 RepID=UPI003CF89D0A